jgi:hypothetical protein
MSTEIQEDTTLIVVNGRRHAKCWVCNKDGSEEKTLKQRLTPLLRTPDGRRYTEDTLRAEMQQDIDTWKKTKYVHPKCEKEAVDGLLKIIDQLDEEAELLRDIQRYVLEHHTEPAFDTMIRELGIGVEPANSTG